MAKEYNLYLRQNYQTDMGKLHLHGDKWNSIDHDIIINSLPLYLSIRNLYSSLSIKSKSVLINSFIIYNDFSKNHIKLTPSIGHFEATVDVNIDQESNIELRSAAKVEEHRYISLNQSVNNIKISSKIGSAQVFNLRELANLDKNTLSDMDNMNLVDLDFILK